MDIKKLRTSINMSQGELASISGIPQNRISNWENGRAKPKAEDYETLRRILLDGREEEYTEEIAVNEPSQEYIPTSADTSTSLRDIHSNMVRINLSLTQAEVRDIEKQATLLQIKLQLDTLSKKMDIIYNLLTQKK